MKTLYLVRHGETWLNVEHKNQGSWDAPLTEKGIKQAEAARDYFKKEGITFDHAYSSTSERACDTLEIITENRVPYTRRKDLKELNFGSFEGKDSFLNPPVPFGDAFVRYGGESDSDLQKRMLKALNEIMEKEDHENVLVVSHGVSCAFVIRGTQATSELKHDGRRLGNCAIMKFLYFEGTFDLVEVINHNFKDLGI